MISPYYTMIRDEEKPILLIVVYFAKAY